MRQGASTSASSQQPPGRQQPAARGDKRLRSWDVDVSLDELVEWDALEQFMSDMPGADPSSRPSSGVPRIGSSDYSLGAHGARLPSLGPMGCLGGVQRSISSDSVGQALGLSSSSSTQQQQNGGLVPGVWPMPGGFGNGAPPGLGGLPRLPAAGSGNAASLAQSLYATWTQPTAFPLQALPMERGVSWGAELLPFMDVGDASGLVGVPAAAAAAAALDGERAAGEEDESAPFAGEAGGVPRPRLLADAKRSEDAHEEAAETSDVTGPPPPPSPPPSPPPPATAAADAAAAGAAPPSSSPPPPPPTSS